MLAANLRFNAVRQGKDVPIVRGTRATRVRTRGTAPTGPWAVLAVPVTVYGLAEASWQQPRARVVCCA